MILVNIKIYVLLTLIYVRHRSINFSRQYAYSSTVSYLNVGLNRFGASWIFINCFHISARSWRSRHYQRSAERLQFHWSWFRCKAFPASSKRSASRRLSSSRAIQCCLSVPKINEQRKAINVTDGLWSDSIKYLFDIDVKLQVMHIFARLKFNVLLHGKLRSLAEPPVPRREVLSQLAKSWEPLFSWINQLEASLLHHMLSSAIAQLLRRSSQELVANGCKQRLHIHVLIDIRQILHRRTHRWRCLAYYFSLKQLREK